MAVLEVHQHTPHFTFRVPQCFVRIVAVLSGGGAKCLAHVGAWRALVEDGHELVHIVATSFGAVVGAAIAAGVPYDGLVAGLLDVSRNDVAPLDFLSVLKGIFADHVIKPDGLRRLLPRLVPAQHFAELHLPLTVTTTDVDSGELVVFGTPVSLAAVTHARYAGAPGAGGERRARVRRDPAARGSGGGRGRTATGQGARQRRAHHDGRAGGAGHRGLAGRRPPLFPPPRADGGWGGGPPGAKV